MKPGTRREDESNQRGRKRKKTTVTETERESDIYSDKEIQKLNDRKSVRDLNDKIKYGEKDMRMR